MFQRLFESTKGVIVRLIPIWTRCSAEEQNRVPQFFDGRCFRWKREMNPITCLSFGFYQNLDQNGCRSGCRAVAETERSCKLSVTARLIFLGRELALLMRLRMAKHKLTTTLWGLYRSSPCIKIFLFCDFWNFSYLMFVLSVTKNFASKFI